MTITKNKCNKCNVVGLVAQVPLDKHASCLRTCRPCDPEGFDAAAEAQKEAWLRGESVER